MDREDDFEFATGELTRLLNDIAVASKIVARDVRRAGLVDAIQGAQGEVNVQGEDQQKLDVVADNQFIKMFESGGEVCGIASEENDDFVAFESTVSKDGKYVVLFDPLDGSSNIDVNISVGTIFSILRCPPDVTEPTVEDFMQPGTEQVCAGFCVYGPTTMMIITTGNGVNGFTLDRDVGEFILTHPKMTIPEETAEFAINMSNQRFWEPPVQRYIDECMSGVDGGREKNFNMRWVASMVAEVYRVLIRGGIFLYPLDTKSGTKGGKLRLLYEASPMSFIVEQAGGLSSTGRERIMEIKPNDVHQRVPVILGSKNEVERLGFYYEDE